MKVLSFATRENELDEYGQNIYDKPTIVELINGKGIILAILHRVEISEFNMNSKSLFSLIALISTHIEGESLDI